MLLYARWEKRCIPLSTKNQKAKPCSKIKKPAKRVFADALRKAALSVISLLWTKMISKRNITTRNFLSNKFILSLRKKYTGLENRFASIPSALSSAPWTEGIV